MKRIIKAQKHLAIILAVAMFSQSCQMYYRASVPLKTAMETSDQQLKKIKTKDGKVYRLRRIEKRNGRIYGQRTKEGIISYLNFTEEEIKSIQLQNMALSELGNVGIVLGTLGAIALIAIAITVRNLDFGTLSFP